MNEIMGYALAVWASPVQAVIVFAILAGVGCGLYRWVQHEPKRPTLNSARSWKLQLHSS